MAPGQRGTWSLNARLRCLRRASDVRHDLIRLDICGPHVAARLTLEDVDREHVTRHLELLDVKAAAIGTWRRTHASTIKADRRLDNQVFPLAVFVSV